VGQSDGSPDQEFQLPAQSVEAESLQIDVEESGLGYRRWQRVDDLALARRDDPFYSLDPEAGLIRFGDNMRGRIPPPSSKIRVAQLRAGGGRAGNLPPGTLTAISARTLRGDPLVPKLKVQQSLPTDGGEDAESLPEAERRIPALFRHRDRAVTVDDYRHLAAETPGTRPGRVEVLPRFKPHQRRSGVPGVVSVMVLPTQDSPAPPNPRPDRPMLETVHAYLDARRPLTAELYVIGCEYVPLALGTGITIQDGFGREGVLQAVRDAVRLALWPLAPGGIAGAGWELGRTVRERELEVVVARVPGVLTVTEVELFTRADDRWRSTRTVRDRPGDVSLEPWQLPELLAVAIDADGGPAPDLSRDASGRLDGGTGGTGGDDTSVGIPVVPETC
jgi:predicted phage baseplate assembly protein